MNQLRVDGLFSSALDRPALAAGALAGAGLLGSVAVFGRPTYDYDPFHSPAALVVASEVIVRGAVEGVREGRTGTGLHSLS